MMPTPLTFHPQFRAEEAARSRGALCLPGARRTWQAPVQKSAHSQKESQLAEPNNNNSSNNTRKKGGDKLGKTHKRTVANPRELMKTGGMADSWERSSVESGSLSHQAIATKVKSHTLEVLYMQGSNKTILLGSMSASAPSCCCSCCW